MADSAASARAGGEPRDGRQDGGLQGSMGPVAAFFLTLTCISPSIAVFIVASDVMGQVGTGVFLCFAAAAALGLVMACVYGEVGSSFPGAGGEYTIFDRVLGRPWGRAIIGLNLLGFSVSLALSGHTVATYLAQVWPALPARAVGPAVVVIVTGVAVLRIQVGAVVTGAFLATEVAALAVVSWFGFGAVQRPLSALAEPLAAGAAGGGALAMPSLAALGAATAASVYAFNGYGAAIFFGDDMRDPHRYTAPVVLAALLAGVLIVMPPVAAVILGAPDLATLARETPIVAVTRQLGGPAVARVISLSIALAVFNTAIAIALMGGRQLYATARDRLWPGRANEVLGAVHGRWGSPWAATLTLGGCGLAAGLLNERVLVLILGNSNVVTYSGLCLAALWGRRNGTTGDAWRMPGWPAVPLLGLVFLTAVAGFTLADPVGRTGLFVTLATLGGSLLLFGRAGGGRPAEVKAG